METIEQEAGRVCGIVDHPPSETNYTVTDHYRVSPDDTYCECGEIDFRDHNGADTVHVPRLERKF